MVDRITDASRVVFLLKEPSNIVDDYCTRPDHQDFNNFITSASEPEKAKSVCNETLKSLNENHYNAIKAGDYYWIERTPESTVDKTVRKVERHFGFFR